MLESKMSHMITQTEQEMVVTIVGGTEQSRRLLNQFAVMLPNILRRFQSDRAISGNVHFDRRVLSLIQGNNFEILAGDDGRINQRENGNWFKMNFIPGSRCHRQRSAEFPARRQPQ